MIAIIGERRDNSNLSNNVKVIIHLTFGIIGIIIIVVKRKKLL